MRPASIHADSGERKNKIPVVSVSLRASAAARRTLIVVARSPRQDHLMSFHSRIRIMPDQSADPMQFGEESAGLLRRRLLFADPERSVVRISHDGSRIAFRAPVGGVLNLWVAPIARVDEARPVTTVTDRNLGPWTVWMWDNRHVVFFRETRPATKIGVPGG
jgi:hypothetical protein